MNNPNLYSGLSLAYIGDAVYELKIREIVLQSGLTRVDDLHKKVVCYTKGEQQAKCIRELIQANFLTEEEIGIYKRGRNSHVNLTRKNIKRADYLDATGFESLIGYLYLNGESLRIDAIIALSIKML